MSTRLDRVADVLRKSISDILLTKAHDQRIGFVSITEVKVSPDLKSAKIFVSCMGDEQEKKRSMRGLRSASKFIQTACAGKLDIKYMPKLIFIRDDSLEKGDHILNLLAQLKTEQQNNEISQPN